MDTLSSSPDPTKRLARWIDRAAADVEPARLIANLKAARLPVLLKQLAAVPEPSP